METREKVDAAPDDRVVRRFTWKREAEWWRCFAHMQMLALAAVAKDSNYVCQCGTEPYTDGDPCPKCFCAWQLAEFQEARKRRDC